MPLSLRLLPLDTDVEARHHDDDDNADDDNSDNKNASNAADARRDSLVWCAAKAPLAVRLHDARDDIVNDVALPPLIALVPRYVFVSL